MKKNVNLVEFTVFDSVTPLVSGYLQAFAETSSNVRSNYTFSQLVYPLNSGRRKILDELSKSKSDIWAFSCYVWNMGLVKKAVSEILENAPEARIILGGPQVINHAERYLSCAFNRDDRVAICNGEGEVTFRNYIDELSESQPDLSKVKGLSFCKDNSLITTGPEELLTDLDDIPSPFLQGYFNSSYVFTIIETSRGCPYSCAFCFWGSGNQRIRKFSEERVREELSWISKNRFYTVYFADANWGLFDRDLMFSEHVAKCKEKYGMPLYAFVLTATNRLDRVLDIVKIFHKAGIKSAASLSIQTLNPSAMKLTDRKNVDLTVMKSVNETLWCYENPGFVELIWPLPGETLETFVDGLQVLFRQEFSPLQIYPLLLLNNTRMEEKKDEFALSVVEADDADSEAAVVVSTKEVDKDEYKRGLWYIFANYVLADCRGLFCLARHLDQTDKKSFASLLGDFVSFCLKSNAVPGFAPFRETIEQLIQHDFAVFWGQIASEIMHAQRRKTTEELYKFVSTSGLVDDKQAMLCFEVDILNRPYVYLNTPTEPIGVPFECLVVLEKLKEGYRVQVPIEYWSILEVLVDQHLIKGEIGDIVTVDHRQADLSFYKGRDKHNWVLAHSSILRVGRLMPVWTPE
jgi:radical SAM superfamily enzyme YgiQ (UPF0313 family)